LLLLVYVTCYVVPSTVQTGNAQVFLYISPQAVVPVAASPYCIRLRSWSSCRHVGCRKVKAFMDDAEVIIPLKGYNPETRTKINSQIYSWSYPQISGWQCFTPHARPLCLHCRCNRP